MKDHQLTDRDLSGIDKNIIAALAYFDVFDHPLTQGEIFLFLGDKCDSEIFNTSLANLLIHGTVHKFDGFYTLKNDAAIAARRRAGNARAERMIITAGKVGHMLAKFPYVRGVAISGSLSKYRADENSDIDLFIITTQDRLWIARTFLHLFKKLTFLVNKEHFFCMNYFVDEKGLEIVEKNIYTATEIVTLMPLEGDLAFDMFYSANAWTRDYLPNNYMRVSKAGALKNNSLKTLLEWALNNKLGNAIDDLFCKITASRWLKKTEQKKLNTRGVIMGMAAGKHYAKPDPRNFQQKLIQRYEHRIRELLPNNEGTVVQV